MANSKRNKSIMGTEKINSIKEQASKLLEIYHSKELELRTLEDMPMSETYQMVVDVDMQKIRKALAKLRDIEAKEWHLSAVSQLSTTRQFELKPIIDEISHPYALAMLSKSLLDDYPEHATYNEMIPYRESVCGNIVIKLDQSGCVVTQPKYTTDRPLAV